MPDGMDNGEVKKMLAECDAIIVGDHFVYKAGKHGPAYIDKERLNVRGAKELTHLATKIVLNATANGLDLKGYNGSSIGVIGPAYGAIQLAMLVAVALEKAFSKISFFPARTELVADDMGKKVHVVPEKLKELYRGYNFIIVEDIVNNGTTIREVTELFKRELDAKILAAFGIADRGEQTIETLGVEAYYPLLRIQMDQYDPRTTGCPLCQQGVPINEKLGKGRRWVDMFGQPPYATGTDFSAFWV